MVVIVDYGVGNIGALTNMFEYLGIEACASSDPDRIAGAQRILLPGVGHFDKAMTELEIRGLVEPVRHAALARGVPVLGICLGMQLLARSSEEGVKPGLGLLDANVRLIAPIDQPEIKVPHMGWSEVEIVNPNDLFPADGTGSRYYFAHSYHVVCDRPETVVAVTDYGGPITAVVAEGVVMGAQFHPEKSHKFGMRVLQKFSEV